MTDSSSNPSLSQSRFLSMASTKIEVLETEQISPPPGSVAESSSSSSSSSVPLTFFDIVFLYRNPTERVFFFPFPHPTSYFLENILPKLKSSLSLTLQRFYLLAGKIQPSIEHESKFVIHYVDGDSVTLTVAEMVASDSSFEELSGSKPRDINTLLPLLPQLPKSPESQPLLALQVTVFPDHGLAIGLVVHHGACDGSGSMHFMSTWASACRTGGSELGLPPVLDRTLISDPRGIYSVYLEATSNFANKTSKPPSLDSNPRVRLLASFTLGGDAIARLKELVKDKANTLSHVSTIVVTYAYAWTCLVKARKYPPEKTVYLIFSADCRGSLKPTALPQTFFGNCTRGVIAKFRVGDPVQNEEDMFVNAARAIGESIQEFKEDCLRDAEMIMEKMMSILPEQPLFVGGSPKFRVYDYDFGWGDELGKPKKVEMTSIRSMGAISVHDSKEDPAGVEIGLLLPEEEMDEFSTRFNNGLLKQHLPDDVISDQPGGETKAVDNGRPCSELADGVSDIGQLIKEVLVGVESLAETKNAAVVVNEIREGTVQCPLHD